MYGTGLNPARRWTYGTFSVTPPLVLEIGKRCQCAGVRGLPIRVMPDAVAWLRRITPPPDLPVLSFRCGKCKSTVILTAGDLHFAA